MDKGRLEAFTDGVIAILITIMVLDLKVPPGIEWKTLHPLFPIFLCYVLSFIFLGIYWNNHHHMLQASDKVNGRILWANLHLLFWLSLIPFVTGCMGENHFAAFPVALYGGVLFMAAIAYYILARALVAQQGQNSKLAIALGKDRKGIISIFIYVVGIASAMVYPAVACGLYVLVAVMWLIPDPRIERYTAGCSS